jgi:hypothetical protein
MTVKPENNAASGSSTGSAKLPYKAPSLVEWGTLRDMTQFVGGNGADDGNKTKNAKKTR